MMIADQLRQFVTTNFYVADPATLADSDSLLDAGIVDSTGVLELIGFIEREYNITVEDQEILPDNLDSIARLAAFVTRKQTG
jgi:acyl carrier protein